MRVFYAFWQVTELAAGYRYTTQRYRCKEKACKRTFNDLTGTLLDGSKRSVMHWILATFLLCLSCASRRIAKELGIHVRTGYRWCWWLRNAALSYEIGRKLDGTVEADDLSHTAGHKGQARKGGTKSLGRKPRGRRKKREPGRGQIPPNLVVRRFRRVPIAT